MEFYTFELDGKKIGYYEEHDEGGVFYSNARLVVDGQKVENPFWIKYEGVKVLAYRRGSGDFLPFPHAGNTYPSSATPLLLKLMEGKNEFIYESFNEGLGKVTGTLTLKRNGGRVEEYDGDKLIRYFIKGGGRVEEYGWGGTAKSKWVKSKGEAISGTAFV